MLRNDLCKLCDPREEKVSRFSNPKDVSDETIFEYLKDHSKSQTRLRFDIGASRIERIERQIIHGIKRRRKTDAEQDIYIVQSALKGMRSSKKIFFLILLYRELQ